MSRCMKTLFINIITVIMTTATVSQKFVLAPLPYYKHSLEPYISEQTIIFHHDKHLAGYVAKLNELIEGTHYADMTLEEIVCQSDGAIFNNAAQTWNHQFYFDQFSPAPQREPSGALAEAIRGQYGNVEELKEQMSKAGLALFGSGWVWLVCDGNKNLSIVSTQNAGTPLTEGKRPLMTIDVWEHAYYIDHRNARAEGIKSFWEVLDWKVIDERFNKCCKR